MNTASKIKLEGERSTHLQKRLNRLSSAKFFGVLYRVNMGRMLLVNLLIVLCCIPAYYVYISAVTAVYNLTMSLPTYSIFGISSGMWIDVYSYISTASTAIYQSYMLWFALAVLMLSFVLSGVFAILRDAFWRGDMTVFASFGRGVKANYGYALISSAVIAGMGVGIVWSYWFIYPTLSTWVGILMLVGMVLVALFVTMYLLILCSVTVAYKQSVFTNLADSWNLFMLNILPTIFRFCMAMLPILLLIAFSSLASLLVVIMLMVGLFYIPFVWQTYMMQVFALFHPIEAVKKSQLNNQQAHQRA